MVGGHITDLIVVSIVVLSGLFALARGLVKELLSIASWAGAVLVTLFLFMPLRGIARGIISWHVAADIATGAALFLGSLFVFSFLSHLVAKVVQGSSVGALDRTLGFVFGLARGVLIVIVLFMALSWAIGPNDQPSWFRNARSVPVLAAGARLLLAIVPEGMRDLFPHITTPAPAPATTPTQSPGRGGYPPAERREMRRLIEGTQ